MGLHMVQYGGTWTSNFFSLYYGDRGRAFWQHRSSTPKAAKDGTISYRPLGHRCVNDGEADGDAASGCQHVWQQGVVWPVVLH